MIQGKMTPGRMAARMDYCYVGCLSGKITDRKDLPLFLYCIKQKSLKNANSGLVQNLRDWQKTDYRNL
jgi:hypothetical protein